MGQCCGGVVEVLFEPLASGMPTWLRELQALHYQREAAVVVTRLGQHSGKWVVTADEVSGPSANDLPNNIVDQARRLLRSRGSAVCADDCFFEPVVASDFNIAVFGAGHVGTAVVRVLSSLDCNVRWIDSRRGVFRQMPANVRVIETAEPALEVAALPPGSCFLVMTHSHALDFEICDRILRRRDAAYCGLIGSHTKRRRFEKRYRALGMPAADLEQLACPIGVDGIRGKKPAEIAVSAAAEVLRAHEQAVTPSATAYPDNVHPLKS
jgi:xanthine dehydrogenase accessory factor